MESDFTATMNRVHLGTSGFVYKDWKGLFYPPKLPAKQWLGHYAGRFETVELNTTFYGLPKRTTVEGWVERTSPSFRFAVKGSRFVTHIKKLKDPVDSLERFFQAVDPLVEAGRLGPVLWQLPPTLKQDLPLLKDFLAVLPRNHQHVMEFRTPDWYTDEVFQALDDAGTSLVMHDMPPVPRMPMPPPGPIHYRRFHGPKAKYQGRYGAERLIPYAAELVVLARTGRECWAFFNNDWDANALFDARTLRGLVIDALFLEPGRPGRGRERGARPPAR